ncbi:MAG: 23S rRNA (guanosine(2251)-2'-O)-methyltransferase RlmB [Planctomyces sp.]
MLELRNPHSILAAIAVRPGAVKSIQIPTLNSGDIWEEIAVRATKLRIPVTEGRRDRTADRGRRDTERAGTGSATVEPPSPVPLEVLLRKPETSDRPALWLALDQVQDPQNLGAVFRLAGFFGIRGIVMTKDRSAPVNATVCDVATGGAEYVAFSIVSNLAQAIEKTQENDIWVLGTCERSAQRIQDVPLDRNWMLVVGNEGQGLRRLTRDRCDQLVSLPASGPVPSLNVAAATSACLAVLTTRMSSDGRAASSGKDVP